jgi:Protein of unknown function (DUF3738)
LDAVRQYVYNILGKAEPGTPREEILAMTRTLLEEKWPIMIWWLRRTGRRFVRSGVSRELPGKNRPGDLDTILPMSSLAYLLSRFETERPVIDVTGLKGYYQVKLQWAWTPPQGTGPEDAGPSLFTALEEQLGLKLESRKGPVEVLVIDGAEKSPTGN